MNLEDAAKEKAKEILLTKGIEVKCPFCKEKFIAKDLLVTCPHCSKTLDVEFNVE